MRHISPIRPISHILNRLTATRRRKFLSALLSLSILISSIRFVFLQPKEALASDILIKFDEGSGTDILDSNNNITGGVDFETNGGGNISDTYSWRGNEFCVEKNCFYFRSVYFNFGDDPDTDIASGDSVTFEGWFRTPDITTTQFPRTIINKFDQTTGTDGGYQIYLNTSGQLVFGIDDDNNQFPSYTVTSNSILDDNRWHHFAAIKNSTNSISLYIDGRFEATNSSITTGTLENTDNFLIGVGFGITPWLGFLDEIAIYKSVRTSDQIKADFLSKTLTRGSSFEVSQKQVVMSDSLIAFWPFDVKPNLNFTDDQSGNGTNLTNSGSTTRSTGRFGQAMDFESTSSQYLYSSDNSVLSLTSSFTISVWIRPETVSAGTYNIVAKWDGTNESYRLMQNGDEVRLELDSGGNYVETTSANLQASTFYHVVGVYDSQKPSAKIYINGLEAATTTAGTIPSSIGDDTGRFHIGAEDSSTTATGFYDGIIDEVRIYNKALDTKEIQDIFYYRPGPIAWWKLDEGRDIFIDGSGNRGVRDSSGNGRYLFLERGNNGGLDWITGKVGSALEFDDVNDSLEGGPVFTGTYDDPYDEIQRLERSNFSITAWVYLRSNTSTTWDMIFSTTGGGGNGIFLIIYDTDEFSILISQYPNWYECYTNQNAVTPGVWHHLAATVDRNDETKCQVYIDGVPSRAASGGNLNSVGDFSSSATPSIGSNGGVDNTFPFNGKIDEVKFYNYYLTRQEIVQDMYLTGHQAPNPLVSTPIAHWRMDDSSGTTAQDSSDNNLDLTLSSASWTLSGKFGAAWNGTGSNWLSILDSDSNGFLDPAANEDFSISLWVKSDSATNPASTEAFVDKILTGTGFGLFFNTSGQIICGIDDDTTGFPEDSATTNSDYYDASWHHVVCIRNITQDRLSIFVDGKLVGEDSDLSATGSLDNAGAFVLGDSNRSDDGNEFNGDIDEVKFYRSSLSPTEVLLDMNFGSSTTFGSVDDHDEEGFALTNPAAWWKMDEGSGTTTNDSSGNGNTSIPFTGDVGWTQGKFGQGLSFDGVDDVVRIPETTSTDLGAPTDSYTITAWFKTSTDFSGTALITAKSAGTNPFPWRLGLNSTERVCMQIYDGTTSSSTCNSLALNDGTWHHVAGVRNTSTDEIYIYVDGVLANSTSDTTTASLSNNDNVSIGNGGALYIANDFQGEIDNVKVYNQALTPAQIAYDFNRGAPLAWYKFDECTGTTANNSAPAASGGDSGLDGTITIGASGTNTSAGTCSSGNSAHAWYNGSTGKFNSSLDFDGTDDYVEVSDNNNLDFSDSQDFTIEAWINRESFTTDDTIIAKKNDQISDAGYILYIDDVNDDVNFVVSDGIDSFLVNGRTQITTTGWYHIVAVFDDDLASGTTIYVNGVQDEESESGTLANVNSLANALNLRIAEESDAGEPFDGKIDNVKIYNYAVTSSQVKKLYNEGSAVRFGPATGNP